MNLPVRRTRNFSSRPGITTRRLAAIGRPAWWSQLREQEFSVKTIQSMIDANARTLGDAARRNARRWPTTSGMYPDHLAFAEDLAQMKSWVEARVQWLDRQIPRRSGLTEK